MRGASTFSWSKITGLFIVVVSIAFIIYQSILEMSIFRYAGIVFEFMLNIGLLIIVFSIGKNEVPYVKHIRKECVQISFVVMQVLLLAIGFTYAFNFKSIPSTVLFFVSEIGLLIYFFFFYGKLVFSNRENNKTEYILFLALSSLVLITLLARDFIF